MISDVYFDEDEEIMSKAHYGWFLAMYISIGYLILREFLQLYHGFMTYLTDPWNLYDIAIIVTTAFATIMMHTTDYVKENMNY